MTFKDYFIIAITIVAIIFFVKSCNNKTTYVDRETIIETRDTIIKYETTTIEKPKLVYQKVIDSIPYIVEVPNIDSSIIIHIPKSQYYYADSSYQAWVTGFECTLDSLKYEKEIVEITHKIERIIEHFQKYGLMAGAAFGSNFKGRYSLTPYLGTEIKGHNFFIGYDVLNKEAQFMYVYKFWKK